MSFAVTVSVDVDGEAGLPCGGAGESLTARLLSETVRVLAAVETDLAPAEVDASRMPTLPARGHTVRVVGVAAGAPHDVSR